MAFNRLAYRHITGAAETAEMFRALPPAVKNDIVRSVLPMAARPMVVEQSRLAPRSQGAVAAYRRRHGMKPLYTTPIVNIIEKRSGGKNAGFAIFARIGPKYPEGAQAHLLEFGTKDRYVNLRSSGAGDLVVRTKSGALYRPAHSAANQSGGLLVTRVSGKELSKLRFVPKTGGKFRYIVDTSHHGYRGRGPVEAFIGPAYESKWQQCLEILRTGIEASQTAAVNRLAAQVPRPQRGAA